MIRGTSDRKMEVPFPVLRMTLLTTPQYTPDLGPWLTLDPKQTGSCDLVCVRGTNSTAQFLHQGTNPTGTETQVRLRDLPRTSGCDRTRESGHWSDLCYSPLWS